MAADSESAIRHPQSTTFDVAVIGAGVVGCAIARELARYGVDCVLIDAASDVGTGTSKANTALLHTGFDAKSGSVEARLVRRGYELLRAFGPDAGIPIEPIGALLLAWDAEQLAALPSIAANAARNGYTATRQVSADELYGAEPHLGPGALGALEVPGESIICPFTTSLAFATQAVTNGVTLALDTPVQSVRAEDGVHVLSSLRGVARAERAEGSPSPSGAGEPSRRRASPDGRDLVGKPSAFSEFRARYLVNAAGLYADVIDRQIGHDAFTVTPRRGELIVFDKLARPLVRHILLPVPTKVSKGVLVSPTVFGNVVLGPTAEDIADKAATGSTAAGIGGLYERGKRILPQLMSEEVTAVYAGLRAATEHSDYQIGFYPSQRYVCVGGIRSTGLSASMAIAEYVVEGLADAGLVLAPKDDFRAVRMPNIGEAFRRPYQSPDAIAANPDYGHIVCHCERVTRGEILDAMRAAIPARSLDGVRRRTRALFGRCQGFFCGAAVTHLVAEATGQKANTLLALEDGP
jgi:glycerol-3-phosphate dehydrogenase